jgi:alpha/beta superfamily hydrolase
MAQKFNFLSDDFQIEGLLEPGGNNGGVVITHPHPLYGGDMYNPVVETIATGYQKKGFTTLCFNFRGTGNSRGSYDEGRGEQADVRAAVAHLDGMGLGFIDLAGYSFGAWVNGLVGPSLTTIRRLVMISPPVAFIDFKDVGRLDSLSLVVTGSEDEVAPAKMVAAAMPDWNRDARLEIVSGADHFYFGYFDTLDKILCDHLNSVHPEMDGH